MSIFSFFSNLFGKNKNSVSASERDKERLSAQKKEDTQQKEKRFIKRTTIHTLPYECFVSNYVCLLRSNVRSGKETGNLYSKTYLVPDINYSALTQEEQLDKMQTYIDLLNGFDDTSSVQLSLINTEINKEEFEGKLFLKEKNDGLDNYRKEFNSILHNRIVQGQNGLQCRKYITITTFAHNFETANSRLCNLEAHLITSLNKLGTNPIPLDANDRVLLMAEILRGVESSKLIQPCTREEFARQSEKMLCSPDYFDFKPRGYFMFGDTYARCLYFRKLPTSMRDTIYKDILELNKSMIISENIDFVEQAEALNLVRRKLTDMRQEQISKVRKAAEAANGAFIDPIEGTQLATDMVQAQEFLEDLQNRNQKMTLGQFLIMIKADSFEELQAVTESLIILLRKYQIETGSAATRQEQAFCSILPIGNSNSLDKTNNIQTRRTLSSESTAVFMPFNACELLHKKGIYYGQNKLSHSLIMFDRTRLKNPNGFLFGVPGSGKSVTAKLEIIFSYLAMDDEVIVVDPEREYVTLAKKLGGEVITISENSTSHINPLDLTENPDVDDREYSAVKAKLDFLLSFFSTIMGNQEITPLQKTVIDSVMTVTYKNHTEPTLKEFYAELEKYESTATDEEKSSVAYLRQALHLYVHGSMNTFAEKSNVNTKKRLVVYDISELGDNLKPLGMTIVLENIWSKIATNRKRGLATRIYIDEMYLMFKSETSSAFFYELYKRARKWGGIPTGITQNVDDLLRSEMARTMISNTQFVMMLAQNATDREQLARLLKIPSETMAYVTNCSAGSGLMYADEFGTIPFENTIPKDTELYQLITTKFAEEKS